MKSDNSINLLIGKDIARTASVQITDEATPLTYIADGEILVLDELHAPLAPGSTVANSQKITIVQGRGVPGKGLKMSTEIDGRNVIRATALSFRAGAEQVTYVGYNAVTATGAIDVAPFTDYKLTIVYNQDTDLFSEQFAPRTFYYTTGATDTQQTIATAFVNMINAELFYNALATVVDNGTDYGIELVGRPLEFDVETAKYNRMRWETMVSGFGTTPVVDQVEMDLGSGEGEQIAELEWFVNGFDGAINRVYFPAPRGTSDADLAADYDILSIEFFDTSEDYAVSGVKPAKCIVHIALVEGSAQTADVLAQLNPWLASTTRQFPALAV